MYKLNHFNFKERKNNYLLTNDLGSYCFISKEEFLNLVNKKTLLIDTKKELEEKGFIYEEDDEIFALKKYMDLRNMKNYLLEPTILHIFVVSKNCNFNCIYCQAGNLDQKKDYLMSKEIAKKAVDIALSSPSDHLNFEFQGGEPLTNFEVIKYIIEYTKSISNKTIDYSVVTNLTLITEEIINYFIDNNVTICTSLDGNKLLQNINRPCKNSNSYEETIKQIKKIKAKTYIGAIQTTTKYSLDKYKEIIDEYVALGMDNIFLRPLTKLGKANERWNRIGYSSEEFLSFYKKALDYIIDLNKKGIFISEGHSVIFLRKIFDNKAANYMELRSPCGGAIGQLAYYYDGKIYTCDEARMLSEMGNDSFSLGDVFTSTYEKIMSSDITKAMCVSSTLECIPYCSSCVYMPYCGTCPVINLAQDNSIFVKNPREYRCEIYSGILDILFNYIENDEEVKNIFRSWIN